MLLVDRLAKIEPFGVRSTVRLCKRASLENRKVSRLAYFVASRVWGILSFRSGEGSPSSSNAR